MTARLSTGLVNKMMDSASFKAAFALGFIDIYSLSSKIAAKRDLA